MENNERKQKVFLCAIARNEERYIKDWVDYHLLKGFDKVIIADNSNVGDNAQMNIINSYSGNTSVVYEDYRGKKSYQCKCYSELYDKYKNECDWIAFWDIDEFIDGCDTINEFVSQEKFKSFNLIYINWKCFGDSDRLDYEPIPVYERFTEPAPKDVIDNTCPPNKVNSHVKTIAKCTKGNLYFLVPHNARHVGFSNEACDAIGNKCRIDTPWKPIVWEGAWLNHYRTLSLGEFLSRRFKRGRATTSKDWTPMDLYKQFFLYNKKTPEKMELFESVAGKISTQKKVIQSNIHSYSGIHGSY